MVPHGDFEILTEQLGREPTTRYEVIVRCPPDGHPLVIRNHPLDAAGEPFPTLYWLTCPEAVRAISRIESTGEISRLNERGDAEEEFARSIQAAHDEYATERARFVPEARSWGGVAGTRVGIKCLQAHFANHLAGGEDPVGRWVATQIEPIHRPGCADRVAAIDQGTNSIRLLVADPTVDGGMEEIARDMVITRLGQDVDRTGRLDPAALARTVDVLQRYVRRAQALRAQRIHMSATSAVRDASNGEEFASTVLELTGEPLDVISGEREAELSFAGAVDALEAQPPFLVVDIGGGSTEFALGTRSPESSVSTQMGSVRLTERYIASDPPATSEMEAMRAEIGRILSEVESEVRVGDASTLVAVAGTATTAQALSLGLTRYEASAIHRSTLSLDDARAVLERLSAMTNEERAALPVMAPGSGDVIVAGCQVLVAMMERWGLDHALVSETDILDGSAAELLRSG
ncbi:MAG: DUF501 domain-containing protein [Actinobacteria bacterium]|nr:DUF501 domain-containing protein [Actinomycetota bacterium]